MTRNINAIVTNFIAQSWHVAFLILMIEWNTIFFWINKLNITVRFNNLFFAGFVGQQYCSLTVMIRQIYNKNMLQLQLNAEPNQTNYLNVLYIKVFDKNYKSKKFEGGHVSF